ncbi:LmbE-like protein [Gloeopeniophorella convolvens]|nr:LmbE-like protein [Gloeopeniophorella convolvens]
MALSAIYIFLASIPLFLSLFLQPWHPDDVFPPQYTHDLSSPPRILLVTAHPDDETFFFGPTLTSLLPDSVDGASSKSVSDSSSQVYSLCLSVGNADGLGLVRRRELDDSLDILGVAKNKRQVLDQPEFPDSMTTIWDADIIATTVGKHVVDKNISIILTFDSYGITGHPNHYSLYHGVSRLLATEPSVTRHPLVAYALTSKPVFVKFTGVINPLLIKLSAVLPTTLQSIVPGGTSRDRPVFVAGVKEYVRAVEATMQHRSQRIWFRWLYLAFSQYMWMNEWEFIPATSGKTAL